MLFESKCQSLADDIVKLVRPLKVIVFGSVARGAKHPRDIDLLIVTPRGHNPRSTAQMLYSSLVRRGMPINLLVVDEDQFNEQANAEWSVVASAISDGKLLYAA